MTPKSETNTDLLPLLEPALWVLALALMLAAYYGLIWYMEKAIDRAGEWVETQARKLHGMMAHMATPVLIALIVSASALAAVVTSTYLVMHYSPYQTCVRNLLLDGDDHHDASVVCAHHLNGK